MIDSFELFLTFGKINFGVNQEFKSFMKNNIAKGHCYEVFKMLNYAHI